MNPPPPVPIESLLRHAAGLRSLARGLLGDPGAADDIVQETWIAAIERPPESSERLGGWLRKVTRNQALQRRREDRRRATREGLASTADDLAPTGDPLRAREVLRDVVDAVLELEEPYQSTVIERFFQDLPPREIARRRGVPVTTVKSQLGRALARLRSRLDSGSGGERRHWAVALAGVMDLEWSAVPVPTGGATAGGISMEWKLMAGAAATTAALLGASRLGLVPGGGTARSMGGTTAPITATVLQAGETSSERSRSPESADRSSREPIAAAEKGSGVALVSSRPRGSHSFTLRGTVVDENDFPLAHAHVYLAPLSLPLCDAGTTALDGTFEAHWRGNAAQTTVALAVRKHDASWSGLSSIALESGEEHELRLRVHGGDQALRGRRKAIEQAQQTEAGVRQVEPLLLEMELAARASLEGTLDLARMPPGYFRTNLDRAVALEIAAGEATFGLAVAPRAVEEVAGVVSLQLADRAKLEMRQRTPYQADAGLSRPLFVSVRDAAGSPVAEARVAAGQDGKWRMAFTDESGIAELPDLARDRAIELRAGGGDRGIATSTFEPGDEPLRWDAVLDRGRELFGSLLGPDGEPLAGWTVEFLAHGDAPWHDATRTAGDGSFAIPNVGAEVGRLFVAPPSSWSFLPARVFEDVRVTGESSRWSLEAVDLGEGSLGLAFGGDGEPEVEVRVWQASSGRGAWLVFDPETQRHVSPKLPAGRYEVVAQSLESGFSKLATVDLGAGEDVDLGTFALLEPARLELPAGITPPAGAEAKVPSLFLHTDACDARVVFEAGSRNVVVPAGTYLLTYEGREFSAPAARISLAPGEVAVASGDLGDRLPVTFVFEVDGTDPLALTLTDEHGGLVHATDLGAERSARTFLSEGSYRLRAESAGRVAEMPFELTVKPNAESAVVRVSID